ncbi:MAG: hypothetical protein D6738_12160 [Acidobacteria bacterium]|nr:MAG: hypothetical protein D6738_12160 [Acidobacteriota bacterium]
MIVPVATMRFADLIDLPAFLLRRPVRALYPIAITGIAVASAPSLWFAVRAGLDGAVVSPLTMAGMYAAGLFAWIASAIANLAVFAGVAACLAGQRPTFLGAYREALRPRRLLAVLATGMVTLFGLCLCLLPGLLFAVMLALVLPVLILEPEHGVSALGRSWQLVAYRPATGRPVWVEVVGVLLVGFLITWALQSIAQVPVLFFQGFDAFQRAAQGSVPVGTSPQVVVAQVLGALVAWAFGALGSIYVAGMHLLMMLKAREVREGVEIERRAAELIDLGASGPASR